MSKLYLVGLIALTYIAFLSTVNGRPLQQDPLDREMDELEVQEPSLAVALVRLSDDFGLRIGFEVSPDDDSTGKPISFKARHISLRDGLLRIVELDPRYAVEFVEGKINVHPVNPDPVLETLLGTRITNFDVDQNSTRLRITDSIFKLPEIKSQIDRVGLTSDDVMISAPDFVKPGAGFVLRAVNRTLREILNEIIDSDRIRFWILVRIGKNRENVVIGF